MHHRKRPAKIVAVMWGIVLLAFSPAVYGVDRTAIEQALAHPNLRGASISVEIRSVSRDKIVYARGARVPLILASNNKLVTTASALHHLGPDFQLATCVYASGVITGERLDGDLIVRGGGDPSLCERFFPGAPFAPLDELARQVAGAGIREVTGTLRLDDTCFDREYTAPGWPPDQLNYYYCAPVAGLGLLENLVQVEVTPGTRAGLAASLRLIPGDAPFTFQNEMITSSKKGENLIHIDRPQPGGALKVNGRTYYGNGTTSYSVTVCDPVAYFGHFLLAALERAGVTVSGGIHLVEHAPDYGNDGLRLLARHASDLLPVVTITNKESHNLFAEHLYKLAGWKVTGRGTFASGHVAAERLFQDLDVSDIDPFTMCDGSGLSRENTFSAHTMVSLLAAVYATEIRDPYLRSLPVAGMDGSLSKRMIEEPYRQRVRGKTGWIRGVSDLSGYVQSLDGDVYAFSILFNDYKGMNGDMKAVQDDICRAIVDG
ncbi:MAG: D-alanyl-D-alanine carboxypeptidase/D-alanyl-D-alanine-endopeptidase [Planctomycetes bacterium]|nr:D-alanyl-D-alanine carboxypeptidase/D-alanyl-D-alanine-endopeptidase [Planctomycetota bacterium]